MQLIATSVEHVNVISVEVNALDASNSKDFKQKMSVFINPGAQVLLNLTKVKFVDSSGLGSILSCLRQLEAMNGEFRLCCMTKSVRSIFELVRMHRVFQIHLTEEEALRSFDAIAQGPIQTR
jgi:anti-sigma B factor antagonist